MQVSKLRIEIPNKCSIIVLKGASTMLELEDFIELYLSASDEVKASIEKILTECQSQTEYPQEHFDKRHTIQ